MRGFGSFVTAVFVWAGTAQAELPANGATVRPVPFEQLKGWENDDLTPALLTFQDTCDKGRTAHFFQASDWAPICAIAKTNPDARTFFESLFHPVLIGGQEDALFTGYFEPELNGAKQRGGKYQTPLYRKPPDLSEGSRYLTRSEIQNGALAGKGLEIAWVDDPVEAFYLQIQGSGRIKFKNGKGLRVGYGGFNGHKYRPVSGELVRRGILSKHEASAARIKNWVRDNPVIGRKMLAFNPSYVFFREVKSLGHGDGPKGAMLESITTMRSVAVDPKYTPLGAPVWLDKRGEIPMQRLMIAQDVGPAIKGPQRADIFFGTGDAAGKAAGRIKDTGRMFVLLPLAAVRRLFPEG